MMLLMDRFSYIISVILTPDPFVFSWFPIFLVHCSYPSSSVQIYVLGGNKTESHSLSYIHTLQQPKPQCISLYGHTLTHTQNGRDKL